MANILVVEDDKLLGKAVVATLEEAGYTVFWAKIHTEAFNFLKTQPVQLVYLDLMLPEVDGYSILGQMKNDPSYQNIPVIILSNLGQMTEINRAMDLGADDYVVKANIDLEKLVELTKKKLLKA